MYKIRIGKQLQRVEYEGLSLICFLCGKVGHWKDSCPSIVLVTTIENSNVPVVEQKTDNPLGGDDASFGLMMLVQTRLRKTNNRATDGKGKNYLQSLMVRMVTVFNFW